MQPVSKTTEQQILEGVPGNKTSRMTNRKPCRKSCYRKSGREKICLQRKEQAKEVSSRAPVQNFEAPGLRRGNQFGLHYKKSLGSRAPEKIWPGSRAPRTPPPPLRGPVCGVLLFQGITATSQLLWGWFGKNIQLSQIDYIPHYLHYKTHRENNWIQYFISHFLHWNNWRLS